MSRNRSSKLNQAGKQKVMPARVQDKVGKGKLEKGKWNQFDIIAWDFSQPCNGSKCELYDICEYRDKRVKRGRKRKDGVNNEGKPAYGGKCGMQLRYMKNALAGVILLYGEGGGKNRMAEMVRVGYHLLPLYNQLFQFSRLEYAEKELTSLSDRGAIRINPVYKEIREIISSLESTWQKIEAKANPGGRKKKTGATAESDGDFLDAMYEVVGASMKSLPLLNDGKDDEIFDKVTNTLEDESGGGMDFGAGDIPDKPPKRKKQKTKAQIARKEMQVRKSGKKLRRKKKLIKTVRKEIAEKEALKALNARIRAERKVIKVQKRKELLADRAGNQADREY